MQILDRVVGPAADFLLLAVAEHARGGCVAAQSPGADPVGKTVALQRDWEVISRAADIDPHRCRAGRERKRAGAQGIRSQAWKLFHTRW